MMSTRAAHELLEVGVISPEPKPTAGARRRRGRLPDHRREGRPPVAGRRHGHHAAAAGRRGRWAATGTPSRWCSPASTRSTARTTRSCATRWTSCSSTTPRWSTSRRPRVRSGFGFRCGFLGLLHMEIVRERLEREFDLDLISTAPNVVYRVVMEDGAEHVGHEPDGVPDGGKIAEVYEPVVKATILAPSDYIGTIMELCQARRGALQRHGLPVRGPGRDPLHAAAGRDRLRLLRRAEVAHPRATRAWTTSRPASRRPSWSRSTSCCRASRSTRSPRSCTRTRPTPTASRWPAS